jgi:hypothetical protein
MKLGQAMRLLLLLLTVAVTGAAVLALAEPWLPRPRTTSVPGFAGLVTGGCAVALLACWAWLALGTVLVAVEALMATAPPAGLRLLVRVPRAVRVLVPVLVGAAVTAAPASASTETGPGGEPARVAAAGPAAGLPLPDRALTRRPAGHAGQRPAGRTVVVRPGDTLWAITARVLPAGSGLAAVDRGWRRVAHANADRVPDPDLIRPGTRLRIPPLTVHPREEA